MAKLYGDFDRFRFGVLANRGQLDHTTRLDTFVGLSGRPADWIRITGGVQIGMLVPDPPCTRRCAEWDDYGPGNRRLVGFGRLTLAVESYPTPRTTIEVLWQTLHVPRPVGYLTADWYLGPFTMLLVYPVGESSLFLQHTLLERRGVRLDGRIEARAIGRMLIGSLDGTDTSAFGPRVGGGFSIGPSSWPSAFEVTAGTSATGLYVTAGCRLGARRENSLW